MDPSMGGIGLELGSANYEIFALGWVKIRLKIVIPTRAEDISV